MKWLGTHKGCHPPIPNDKSLQEHKGEKIFISVAVTVTAEKNRFA